jgi:hypothetical protein
MGSFKVPDSVTKQYSEELKKSSIPDPQGIENILKQFDAAAREMASQT